ncbi:MAG: ferrous iron transport protein B, partial [candidate division Zixibacteria bacterium]|nr:ferrous iron transport protein B [candidate division Zixibacteria bacterium]
MERRASSQVGSRELTIAICGNPNCGKTTLFNALTGLSQRVGNYPGVTVEKTTGSFAVENRPDLRFHLVDIPGSYSLLAFSPDEYIATQVLCGEIAGENRPDLILCVIDATNLDRGLYLLFQVVEVGCPVVVVLNMVDLAERHGITVDSLRLEKLLPGIPVSPVVASKGQGIESLKSVLAGVADCPILASIGVYDEQVLQMAQELASQATGKTRTNAQYLRVLFDQGGPAESAFIESEGASGQIALEGIRRTIREKYGALSVGETGPLTQRATTIAREVVSTRSGQSHTKSERIDRFLLHPVLGPAILAAIMVFMFQSVFSWAEPAMHLIGSVFASLAGYLEGAMVEGPLRSLAVDGVIGGVGSVLVFLPQIVILFFFISLLEDSGYMPRAAFLVDRLFGWCGLSGKSFVPMLSSFACAVPGIMATRTIENRKLRIITILVAPLMSCSARLPVYTIMIAAFIPLRSYFGLFNSRGLVLTGLYALGMVLAVLISFLLNLLLFRQERSTFMMDMPSYTTPTLRSILIRIYTRVKSFVGRAGTVILAITIVIWALSYYPRPRDLAEEFDRREIEIRNRYELPQAALEMPVPESGAKDEL